MEEQLVTPASETTSNKTADKQLSRQTNECQDCKIKFESSASLEVHLQYHNQNLLNKWAAEAASEGDPPCPPIGPPLVKSNSVSEAPQLVQVPGSVESRVAVAAAGVVSSSAGPCRPPSSMQISMAQSMGIQQGAPPHLTTHHTNPIFNSPAVSGQSEPSPGVPPTPPGLGLPSIANDVSEFFSQLESRPEVGLNHAGLDLESWSRETDQTKSPRFHPYGEGGRSYPLSSTTSAMTHSNNSQSFAAYQAPFGDGLAYQGSHGYLETFNTGPPDQPHDQSSEEIWDMDSHTVKRYNPGPDPVSPGPIPTTPTMYGSGHPVQQMQSKVPWDQSANMYSPYDVMGRNPPPGMPPLSVSPGLGGPWMGSMNLKTHGVADSKRPKSYQCEACDKWFTSSGHLKRHYNTTLHKNAMKQKGDGYVDGINGGSLSIPSVESRGAPSPCMSIGEESSQSSVCDEVSSQSTQSSQLSVGGSTVSTPGPVSSINILNHQTTSQPDSSSPSSNTSPNVPRASPRSQSLVSPALPSSAGVCMLPATNLGSPASSPLSGMSQLAGVQAPATPQQPSQPMSSNSPMTPGGSIPLSPSSRNPAASPAHQQTNVNNSNRFSPFRAGPPNNPSYKVQNLENNYPTYPTTFQTITPPSHQVTCPQQFNGDYRNQSTGYRHNVVVSEQYSANTYGGQYHNYQTMINYSSPGYDMNHGSYLPSFSSDISSYGQMSNEGMQGIFPANIRTIKPGLDERDSPEGSEGSEASLKNETGEFRCNECNKVFNRVCYLKQHNKSFHNGEKPFKCTQCGKRFPVEVLYQEHLAKHAGDKPYKCDVCPKQFNHKTDLRRHMCLHTGEKPFTCDVCGKGFIREDRMVKHADTHKKKAAHVPGGLM